MKRGNREALRIVAACCALLLPAIAQADAPLEGGKLVIGVQQEPDNLNPVFTSMSVTQDLLILIGATPFDFDTKGTLYAKLAREVPSFENGGISHDELTYRIRFRSNAKWHDGTPMTSGDLKFTWNAIMEPNSASLTRQGWDRIASMDDSDPAVAVIRLREPYGAFLTTFVNSGGGLLPKHVLEKSAALRNDPWNNQPMVNCGPYKFEKWVRGNYVSVVRNPDWCLGAPHIERIIYEVIPNENTLFTQLQTGEIGLWNAIQNLHQLDAVANIPNVTLYDFPMLGVEHLDLNLRHVPLQDVRVRRAIAHAINKKEISETVYRGRYRPATGVRPPLSWDFTSHVAQYPFDLGKSRSLLDEAGWKLDGEVRWKTIDGKKTPLRLVLISTSGRPLRQQVENVLQQALKSIGIGLEIQELPASHLFETGSGALPHGDFDLALYAWIPSADPSSVETSFMGKYIPPNGQNYLFYQSKDADRLLTAGGRAFDRKVRAEAYRKFQEVVARDVPAIPLLYWQGFSAATVRLHGIRPNSSGSFYWNVNEWWMDK